ncbi:MULTISPECIES: DNA/RNA nuclease SfsA [Desulfococcus]|jgi:sugar fermentation stimulation protein A|nr:DNA/RNA nuclease SfsA [Desulfococcus multivorans]MDX9818185.1 DNA/RNA nuclease SfsA [Desulfococcus multivorans]
MIPGRLIKRYRRFLADVVLENGQAVTAHCPNSGKMTSCCEPGMPVYLSFHDNPKRKLKYTWEIIRMPTSLVGVNTLVPNRLVAASIGQGLVEELSGYASVQREASVGRNSRIDLLLSDGAGGRCYVEVKNCTWVQDGVASFPDAVTARGLKHLVELRRLAKKGDRCVMFYLIQRMDAEYFVPADEIDPKYGEGLRLAAKEGVEILVFDVVITLEWIRLNKRIPYRL